MSDETKQKLKNIHDAVLEAIHTDAVAMRPRYHFVLKSTLWFLGACVAFGVLLYFMSFVAFVFRSNDLLLLPYIGPGGWASFFLSLPWLLLLGVFVLFLVLQVLSTHFAFVYKRPLVHTILGSVFLLVIGSTLIGQATLHERVYERNRQHPLLVADMLYGHAIKDPHNVRTGIVVARTSETMRVRGNDGTEFLVHITPTTKMPLPPIAAGTPVMIIGEERSGTITARGIRPLERGRYLPFPYGKTPEK